MALIAAHLNAEVRLLLWRVFFIPHVAFWPLFWYWLTNSECLIGILMLFFGGPLFMGVRHLAHVLSVPPTKACLLCATPAGVDLYIQAMPLGTY